MYWQRYRYFHMNSLISSLLLACFLMTLTRLARPFAFNFLTKFNRSVKVLSTAASKVDTSANPMIFSKYDVVEVSEIEEYSLQATLFRHKKSGAQVMSVKAADENKVFGITFRTPPKDSKGIPHILEHSVLCGSRKFPVKEPFVDLLRGKYVFYHLSLLNFKVLISYIISSIQGRFKTS